MHQPERLSQASGLAEIAQNVLENGDVFTHCPDWNVLNNLKSGIAPLTIGAIIDVNARLDGPDIPNYLSHGDLEISAGLTIVANAITRARIVHKVQSALDQQSKLQRQYNQPLELYRFHSDKNYVGCRWYGFDSAYSSDRLDEKAALTSFRSFVKSARDTPIETVTISAQIINDLDEATQANYKPAELSPFTQLQKIYNIRDTLADPEVLDLTIPQAEKLIEQLTAEDRPQLLDQIMKLLHQKQPGSRVAVSYQKWQASQSNKDYALFTSSLKTALTDCFADETLLASGKRTNYVTGDRKRPAVNAIINGAYVTTFQNSRNAMNSQSTHSTSGRQKIVIGSTTEKANNLLRRPRAAKLEELLKVSYSLTSEAPDTTRNHVSNDVTLQADATTNILPFQQRFGECIAFWSLHPTIKQLEQRAIATTSTSPRGDRVSSLVNRNLIRYIGVIVGIGYTSLSLSPSIADLEHRLDNGISHSTTLAIQRAHPSHKLAANFQATNQQIAEYKTSHAFSPSVITQYAIGLDSKLRNVIEDIHTDNKSLQQPPESRQALASNVYGSSSAGAAIGDVNVPPSEQPIWNITAQDKQSDKGYWSQSSYQNIFVYSDPHDTSKIIPPFAGLSLTDYPDVTISTQDVALVAPNAIHGKDLQLSGEVWPDANSSTKYKADEKDHYSITSLPVLNGLTISAVEVTNNTARDTSKRPDTDFHVVRTGNDYNLLIPTDVTKAHVTYWLTPQLVSKPPVALEPTEIIYQDNQSPQIIQPLASAVTPKQQAEMQHSIGGSGSDSAATLATDISHKDYYSFTPITDNSNLFDWNQAAPRKIQPMIVGIGKALAEIPEQICNTAATTDLIASRGMNGQGNFLNTEVGYNNSNVSRADDGKLTANEAHEWLIDRKGTIIDATPGRSLTISDAASKQKHIYAAGLYRSGEAMAALSIVGIMGLTYRNRRHLAATKSQVVSKQAERRLATIPNGDSTKAHQLSADFDLISWLHCAPTTENYSDYIARDNPKELQPSDWNLLPTSDKAAFSKLLLDRHVPRSEHARLQRLIRLVTASRII